MAESFTCQSLASHPQYKAKPVEVYNVAKDWLERFRVTHAKTISK